MSTKIVRGHIVDAVRPYQSRFPIDADTPVFRAFERRLERSLADLVARWTPPADPRGEARPRPR